MKLLIIIGLLILASCNVSKPVISNTKDISISLPKMQCGSYEVRNSETVIGYVVKPFIVELNRSAEITQFEKLLRASYANRYDNFFRVYLFTKNNSADTILNVIFLNPKLAFSIPNWKCEEQDVDTYFRSKKYPRSSNSITYNCSKARFKILGDPD